MALEGLKISLGEELRREELGGRSKKNQTLVLTMGLFLGKITENVKMLH